MKILILAFRSTIAEQVAKRLAPAEKVLLESSKDWLEGFVAQTDFAQYNYVVAIGAYSGRDQNAIRIETKCSSQFRGGKGNLRRLAMPYSFKPELPFKLADGIGNSWCNLVSYKIMSMHPKTSYTFLHIPKNFDVVLAARSIDKELTRVGSTRQA